MFSISTKKWLSSATVAAIALGGLVYFLRPEVTTEQVPTMASRYVVVPQTPLAAAALPVAQPMEAQRTSAVTSVELAATQPLSKPGTMSNATDPYTEIQDHIRGQFEALDKAVLSGSADPNWMPQEEIATKIALADPKSKVIDTKCNADFCRIEIWHPNAADKSSFFAKLTPHLPPRVEQGKQADAADKNIFAGGMTLNAYNNNPGVTHMYVSRPGRNYGGAAGSVQLPRPEIMQALNEQKERMMTGHGPGPDMKWVQPNK